MIEILERIEKDPRNNADSYVDLLYRDDLAIFYAGKGHTAEAFSTEEQAEKSRSEVHLKIGKLSAMTMSVGFDHEHQAAMVSPTMFFCTVAGLHAAHTKLLASNLPSQKIDEALGRFLPYPVADCPAGDDGGMNIESARHWLESGGRNEVPPLWISDRMLSGFVDYMCDEWLPATIEPLPEYQPIPKRIAIVRDGITGSYYGQDCKVAVLASYEGGFLSLALAPSDRVDPEFLSEWFHSSMGYTDHILGDNSEGMVPPDEILVWPMMGGAKWKTEWLVRNGIGTPTGQVIEQGWEWPVVKLDPSFYLDCVRLLGIGRDG